MTSEPIQECSNCGATGVKLKENSVRGVKWQDLPHMVKLCAYCQCIPESSKHDQGLRAIARMMATLECNMREEKP